MLSGTASQNKCFVMELQETLDTLFNFQNILEHPTLLAICSVELIQITFQTSPNETGIHYQKY